MHTYVIAEVGINHNGDIELAKELIHKAFIAGCDAVKFQKRDIESVYTQEELDTPRESPFGTTTREQKEGIEFNIEQYKELQAYAEELSLDFIVSCWDQMSLFQVEKHLDVKYHKVAVEYVLACTSTYPTAPEEVNLRYLETLKRLYPNTKVGFSNHYNGMDACVGSVALGAECVEFHITKQRAMYGSDQAASIQDVDDLCDAIRKMEVMLGDGIKVVYDTEKPIAQKLRKVNNTVE